MTAGEPSPRHGCGIGPVPLTDPLPAACGVNPASTSVELRIFVRRVGHGPGGRRVLVSDSRGTRPRGGGGTPGTGTRRPPRCWPHRGSPPHPPHCGVACAKVPRPWRIPACARRAEAWHAAHPWPPRTNDGGHDAPSRSPAPAAPWPLPSSCRTRPPGCPWSCGDWPGHRPTHGPGGNASDPPAPPL